MIQDPPLRNPLPMTPVEKRYSSLHLLWPHQQYYFHPINPLIHGEAEGPTII